MNTPPADHDAFRISASSCLLSKGAKLGDQTWLALLIPVELNDDVFRRLPTARGGV